MLYDPTEITKLFLFGTANPSDDYNEHIRPNGSEPDSKRFDMSDYMLNGAGRYAYPSIFGAIEKFFNADSIEDGIYDEPDEISTLFNNLNINPDLENPANTDVVRSISQYGTDINTADHTDRSYIFGGTTFRLNLSAATFNVSGAQRSISGFEVRANDDDFDFEGTNELINAFNNLIETATDPYGLAREAVDLEFRGTGRVYNSYDQNNFRADNDDGILDVTSNEGDVSIIGTTSRFAQDALGFTALGVRAPFFIRELREDPFLDYEKGKFSVVYGTPGNDNLNLLSATAEFFDVEPVALSLFLVGGGGNDTLTGSLLEDELTGGSGNDFLDGGSGRDVAIYAGNVSDYEFSISDDGSTVTIEDTRSIENNEGVDTLINVEFAQFNDNLEVQLLGNTLRFTRDFYTGTIQSRSVVFDLLREGDTSFPFSIDVDGTTTSTNAGAYRDGTELLAPGGSPTFNTGLIGTSEVDGDITFDIEISIADDNDNPLANLIVIEDNAASGVFIGERVDNRGGTVFNDPHLITFDNLSYDFQAAGDFVLTRATEGPAYEVQVRFKAQSSAVSVTETMATTVGNQTVSIGVNDDRASVLLIDGQETNVVSGGSLTLDSGSISRSGRSYTINHGNGDLTEISVRSTFINVTPKPSIDRPLGSIEGLLGDANGNPDNEFQLANGTVLDTPIPSEVLYGDYAASWFVSPEDSLLPGTPEPYVPPGRIVTVDSLPAALREEAERAVDAAGITNQQLRDAAILDFALTGNEEFIEATAEIDEDFDPIVGTTPVDLDPVTSPVVILASDRTELIEEDADNRTATFTVARGTTEGDLTFTYSVAGIGDNPTSAEDFQDSITTGTVTIQDGADTATFDVMIADDATVEDVETFDVSIAPEAAQLDDVELLVSSIRLSVESGDEETNVFVDGQNDGGEGFATDEDTAFTTANVLANDSGGNESLTVTEFSTTRTIGTVSDNGDGTFNYDPNGQFDSLGEGETATDSFVYTVADSSGATDMAVVSIDIAGVDDANVFVDGQNDGGEGFATDENTAFTTANVLANDSGGDGPLTVTGFSTTRTIGTVSDNGDGTFNYDPNGQFDSLAEGEIATDSFVYTVSDDNGVTDQVVVSIDITGLDDVSMPNPTTGPTEGDDVISISHPNRRTNALGGNDIVVGSNGNDEIFGDGGDDLLRGAGEGVLGGHDSIFGGTGNDTVIGGSGRDLLFGESGHDFLLGEGGNDFLVGGSGDDILYGDGLDGAARWPRCLCDRPRQRYGYYSGF